MKKSTASRLAFAAFAAACIGAPPASALHRCVSKEGKVTYTEFECADGVKKSDVKIYDSAGVVSKGAAGADAKKGSAPVKSGPTSGGTPQKGPANALEQERRERDQREQAAEDKRRQDIEEQNEKTRKAAGGR